MFFLLLLQQKNTYLKTKTNPTPSIIVDTKKRHYKKLKTNLIPLPHIARKKHTQKGPKINQYFF
jgi:hypothetical protein